MTRNRVHRLKTWDRYFDAVEAGEKTFEVRVNDRAFQTGDVLELVRIEPMRFYVSHGHDDPYKDEPTLRKRVTYLLQGGQFGIEPGYCVMGIADAETDQ